MEAEVAEGSITVCPVGHTTPSSGELGRGRVYEAKTLSQMLLSDPTIAFLYGSDSLKGRPLPLTSGIHGDNDY